MLVMKSSHFRFRCINRDLPRLLLQRQPECANRLAYCATQAYSYIWHATEERPPDTCLNVPICDLEGGTGLKIDNLQTTVMPATSIRIMAEILADEGFDPAEALRQSGLSASILTEPRAQVSGIEELAFQRILHECTQDRHDLWFEVGTRYRVMGYGTCGLAMMTSANLSQMMREARVWSPLVFSLSDYHPIEEDGVVIGLEYDLSEVPERLREFTVHRDLGAGTTAFAEIVPGFRLERIELAFPRPAVALPEPTASAIYDAPRSALIWGRELALLPMRHADPVLHSGFVQSCVELVEDMQRRSSFLRAVIEVLEDTSQRHNIDTAARALRMSKRTFQRRLQDHSMTFHDVLGTVRARQAKEMLRQPGCSIADVAWQMGYADATGFSHAFRRWTGLSPRAFRERGEVGAGS